MLKNPKKPISKISKGGTLAMLKSTKLIIKGGLCYRFAMVSPHCIHIQDAACSLVSGCRLVVGWSVWVWLWAGWC